MTHFDDAERERLHRFCQEAHALLRRSAVMPLTRLLAAGPERHLAGTDEELGQALAAVQRALRLLEYALADTEPVPYQRRSTDKLT